VFSGAYSYMNRETKMQRFISLSILISTACLLLANPTYASDNNLTSAVKISDVYVHDCCGRGPYVAAILDKAVADPSNCNVVPTKNFVAISINSPLANHLLSVALAAKTTGALVDIWSKDACDSTGAFNEWTGIRMY